jgi:hypothetical protein
MRSPHALVPPARTALAAIGLALLLSACTGGAPAPPASPPAGADSAPAESASAGSLQAALLTASDLPPGFAVTNDPTGTDTATGCPQLDTDVEQGARDHAQVLFKAGALGPYIRERLVRLGPGEAQQRVSAIQSVAGSCATFSTHDDTIGTIEFTTSTLTIDKLGDATAAVRLTGHPTIADIVLYQDLVAVRRGGTLLLISQVSYAAIDTDLTRSTARKAVEKLQGRP